ncbi:MAG TPA: molybdopterin-dependent oxidoreductase [Pseudonocardiaceae bacterium]|nr:molybdopterin-dependent oxidoreductase [Pseudonocardiaceae bacterium]
MLDHSQRLTEPLVRDRRDGSLNPTTWDDALDRVTRAVHRTQQHHGPDAVGCFGGGGLTNEKP